ncbi:unnamed protein product [Fraxinus pennsylvanica]|uniref:Uncharacterized protein n=1 Tax=Fraxinus pennsylvanica TaxID=56036 RepID=A0AAD2ABU9_9LAMI|nr:unnamed protein product [Fraxinus pennsylvanica]
MHIVVPTADDYSMSLGAAVTVCVSVLAEQLTDVISLTVCHLTSACKLQQVLLVLVLSEWEPAQESEVNNVQQESNGLENDKLEKGLAQPLLLTSTENEQDDEGDQEFDGSDEAPEESRLSAYRLLTPSVMLCA